MREARGYFSFFFVKTEEDAQRIKARWGRLFWEVSRLVICDEALVPGDGRVPAVVVDPDICALSSGEWNDRKATECIAKLYGDPIEHYLDGVSVRCGGAPVEVAPVMVTHWAVMVLPVVDGVVGRAALQRPV